MATPGSFINGSSKMFLLFYFFFFHGLTCVKSTSFSEIVNGNESMINFKSFNFFLRFQKYKPCFVKLRLNVVLYFLFILVSPSLPLVSLYFIYYQMLTISSLAPNPCFFYMFHQIIGSKLIQYPISVKIIIFRF